MPTCTFCGDHSSAAPLAAIAPALGVPHPPLPEGFLPQLALTLCPAPFPQGFSPSQPGGQESRSTDSPLSPRPAQSKVGTSLGACRSRARLSPGTPEPRAFSSHRHASSPWVGHPIPWVTLPSSSLLAQQLLATSLASIFLLTNSFLPSSVRVPVGDTVRMGPLSTTASFAQLQACCASWK